MVSHGKGKKIKFTVLGDGWSSAKQTCFMCPALLERLFELMEPQVKEDSNELENGYDEPGY